MFFGAKKSHPRLAALQGIAKLPNANDVYAIWQEATTHKGRTASLRWMFGNPPLSYCLTVAATTVTPDDPLTWTLTSAAGTDTTTLWTQVTSDHATIHGLVLAEFPKEESPALPSEVSGAEALPAESPAEIKQEEAADSPVNGDAPGQASIALEPQAFEEPLHEGELAKTEMTRLLKSVVSSKQTGKLEIQHKAGISAAFFKDGTPIHASHEGLEGDSAIIELIGLKEGSYKFTAKETAEQITVLKRLDLLMQDRAALDHYDDYLKQQGLKDDSCLKRLYPGLSEQEFETAVGQAAPADMQLQKQIYLSIDGKTTLSNILRKNSLSRHETLPALFNLLTCKLVVIFQPKSEPVPISSAAIDLDKHVLHTLRKGLTRPETGLYTYPAFLLFLDQEMSRYVTYKRPFSLVTMKLSFRDLVANDLSMQEVAVRALSEPLIRITGFKRSCDIFCHYKTSNFVLIMPETDSTTTTQLTTHMAERLKDCAFTGQTGASHPLTLEIGTVSVPEHGDTLEKILAVAESYQKVF